MTAANKVFDAINNFKGSAEVDSPDNGDFFVTVGDNIYPTEKHDPQPWEFEEMMNLF